MSTIDRVAVNQGLSLRGILLYIPCNIPHMTKGVVG